MLQAKDLMHTDFVTIGPDDPASKAVNLLLERNISGLPVVDSAGCLLGVISEFDLLDLVWAPESARTNKVYQYMTRDVQAVAETTSLNEVAELFRIRSLRRLPVVRDEHLVGVISRHDLLKSIAEARRQQPSVAAGITVPAGPAVSTPVEL